MAGLFPLFRRHLDKTVCSHREGIRAISICFSLQMFMHRHIGNMTARAPVRQPGIRAELAYIRICVSRQAARFTSTRMHERVCLAWPGLTRVFATCRNVTRRRPTQNTTIHNHFLLLPAVAPESITSTRYTSTDAVMTSYTYELIELGDDAHGLGCKCCRFTSGLDLPIPKKLSIKEIEKHAKTFSASVLKDWLMLNAAIKRFEGKSYPSI
jgi:hypothetical protein